MRGRIIRELQRAEHCRQDCVQLASVNIPIIMLDAGWSIRRMTPQVQDVLGITSADVGRPIRHIRMKSSVHDLEWRMLD